MNRRNTRAPAPASGAGGCTCTPAWPALTALIDDTPYTVTPAPSHSPASALYLARCTGCGTPYLGPWKRLVVPPSQAA
ncbi:hypothetical protein [Streptomyces griseochromogenes]|uniref:hypothetical protein n=1 Tax=Streptomyces griseochromogenes TaxID=68214 RepID=UPI0037B3C545